jgi:hypothetical protein
LNDWSSATVGMLKELCINIDCRKSTWSGSWNCMYQNNSARPNTGSERVLSVIEDVFDCIMEVWKRRVRIPAEVEIGTATISWSMFSTFPACYGRSSCKPNQIHSTASFMAPLEARFWKVCNRRRKCTNMWSELFVPREITF